MNKYLKPIPEMNIRGCKTYDDFKQAILSAFHLTHSDIKDINIDHFSSHYYAKVTKSGNIIVWKV